MLRIAIYARVSTVDKGHDTENQLRELRQFVANKAASGWTPAGEYVDQASGKTANRPEFQRLFREIGPTHFKNATALYWRDPCHTFDGLHQTGHPLSLATIATRLNSFAFFFLQRSEQS